MTLTKQWITTVITLCLATIARSEFTWINTPQEMIVGQTYTISWTGASSGVTVYVKGSEADSSWRSYIYGSGTETSTTFTLTDNYIPQNLYGPIGINDRYCVLAAWDEAQPGVQHVSPPIYIHVPYPTTVRGKRRSD